MSKACLLLLAFLAASLAGLAAGHAAGPEKPIFDRDWLALSSTAMGVTGDARLTPTSITFNKRVTFKLRYLSEVTSPDPEKYWNDVSTFSLYEIVDAKPQAIHNGNHFCGHPDFSKTIDTARYIAVGYHTESDELELVVFSNATPPAVSLRTKGICGNFSYFVKEPGKK